MKGEFACERFFSTSNLAEGKSLFCGKIPFVKTNRRILSYDLDIFTTRTNFWTKKEREKGVGKERQYIILKSLLNFSEVAIIEKIIVLDISNFF